MVAAETLLTRAEVIALFMATGRYANAHSAGSRIDQLADAADGIEDQYVPAPGRRAARHAKRYTKSSVDRYLAGRASHRGPDEIHLLLSRLNQQIAETAAAREATGKAKAKAATEIHWRDVRIADLQKQVRLQEAELGTVNGLLGDERGARHTLDDVIIQLIAPKDSSGI